MRVVCILFTLSDSVLTRDNLFLKRDRHRAFCVILCRPLKGIRAMTFAENDLNHVVSTFVDSEYEILIFCHSYYVDMSEVQMIF